MKCTAGCREGKVIDSNSGNLKICDHCHGTGKEPAVTMSEYMHAAVVRKAR